jgi:hypothetical protein
MIAWVRSRVTINELADGWQLVWSDGKRSRTKTAVGALDAVKRRDKRSAQAGACCLTTIEWNTTTRGGGMVVRVLCGR